MHLSANPQDRERLIREPELLDIATEEFLRKFAPSQSMARTVRSDTEVGGCPVAAGERVLIPWVAANHDPAMYPDPDRVLLDRQPRTHLSFGIGSHRCAGAHLARAMFRAMVTAVLTRIPDYQVQVEGLVKNESVGSQAGWDSIPVVFTPGTRIGMTAGIREAGYFDLRPMTVDAITAEAEGVVSVRLSAPDGGELPAWEPGAHLDLVLPSGKVRQYSLCSDPADRDSYLVAVLREPAGRGGSAEVHDGLRPGDAVSLRGPRNHFRLVPATHYQFIAGGIGITPILAMAREAAQRGATWSLAYGGRSRASMAFVDSLLALGAQNVTLVPQDELGSSGPGRHPRRAACRGRRLLLRAGGPAAGGRGRVRRGAGAAVAARRAVHPARRRQGRPDPRRRRGVRGRAGPGRAHRHGARRPHAARGRQRGDPGCAVRLRGRLLRRRARPGCSPGSRSTATRS